MMDPIERYKAAYKARHGREVDVIKRGSWLVLGTEVFAPKVRKSELNALSARLEYLARQFKRKD